MPTQLDDEIGERLGDVGQEFGATTGRPRRCGWFDGVAARYAVRVNGCDVLVVTKLDVLDGIDPLRICVAYEVDGVRCEQMPADLTSAETITPIYEDCPGWQGSVIGARSREELPSKARAYLDRIAEVSGCPIGIASNGADREAIVVMPDSPLDALVP